MKHSIHTIAYVCVHAKSLQSYLTLCHFMDQPTRFLCPWDFPGKNTGVGCHFFLQGIFPTQGSNPGLPHYRQTLYCLSHQGSPQGYPNSSVGRESACNAGDPSSVPESGRSAGERIGYPLHYCWASLLAQLVKNPPAMQETLLLQKNFYQLGRENLRIQIGKLFKCLTGNYTTGFRQSSCNLLFSV